MTISWGIYSITLLVGSVQGLVIAQLLLLTPANRAANRALALLILTVVLLVTPYTLGFAGFYDRFRWLNFAPFYWELAFGPLVWLYVRQLGHRQLPKRWGWHFVPAMLQGTYFTVIWLFVPTPLKDPYNEHFHVIWVIPILRIAKYVSYLVYAIVVARTFLQYQRWLGDNSGLREEFRLTWLRLTLWSITTVLVLQGTYTLYDVAVAPLDYRDEYPLYVVFAVLTWILGLEGWRNAARHYPKMDEDSLHALPNHKIATANNLHWPNVADQWIAEIEQGGWWREPDLSLSEAARRLGTNTAYLSRALNQGAGANFSSCINRIRVIAAKGRLQEPGANILDIGLDVGFASKSSFNRVFKAQTGLTPSQWRHRQASEGIKT